MSKIAPAPFIIFVLVLIGGSAVAAARFDLPTAAMAGFDAAAIIFLLSHVQLLNDVAKQMRGHSKANDANRPVLLAISVAVTIVVLIAVGAVITKSHGLGLSEVVMVIVTLALAWLFGNVVYALHYANMFYRLDPSDGVGDAAGIEFPGTEEPNYWDFLYFAFTLGMTFQTSDCDITSPSIRRVAIGHCMAAFVFNLGVLAFTINALGS